MCGLLDGKSGHAGSVNLASIPGEMVFHISLSSHGARKMSETCGTGKAERTPPLKDELAGMPCKPAHQPLKPQP